MTSTMTDAAVLLDACRERGWSLATAESLTGGGVCTALTDVAGASDVVRGGVVAYRSSLKARLLGVDRSRLEEAGPVDQVVAEQMALGAIEATGADVAIATTGVAGPGPADGYDAGTVHIAVSAPCGAAHVLLHLDGTRAEVREQTVGEALRLAYAVVTSSNA
ncbi:CinA family protein [Nanchangia anserum]|uniref:CinA family protein n=1 Tax=Nanchangia anserum TaxID=2692125 RepID=A0A8I0KWS2_9ACTO|nr:CinA family protein [Nanchangia anserum]MBD3690264.1 CinA family protein [Nanchangia anserum]QOX82299.1 CinA family protein [Nanchangia anserum]